MCKKKFGMDLICVQVKCLMNSQPGVSEPCSNPGGSRRKTDASGRQSSVRWFGRYEQVGRVVGVYSCVPMGHWEA